VQQAKNNIRSSRSSRSAATTLSVPYFYILYHLNTEKAKKKHNKVDDFFKKFATIKHDYDIKLCLITFLNYYIILLIWSYLRLHLAATISRQNSAATSQVTYNAYLIERYTQQNNLLKHEIVYKFF